LYPLIDLFFSVALNPALKTIWNSPRVGLRRTHVVNILHSSPQGDADTNVNDNADDVENHVLDVVADSTTELQEKDITDAGYPQLVSHSSDSSQNLDASARENPSRWSLVRSSSTSSSLLVELESGTANTALPLRALPKSTAPLHSNLEQPDVEPKVLESPADDESLYGSKVDTLCSQLRLPTDADENHTQSGAKAI
jgi:hypothetical protein